MKQLRAERYPAWLAQQHGLNGETAINIMTAALDAIAKAATTGEPMNAPTSQTQRETLTSSGQAIWRRRSRSSIAATAPRVRRRHRPPLRAKAPAVARQRLDRTCT